MPDKACRACGKLFHVKLSAFDKKTYCSKSCMAIDYSNRLSGTNNPNYRPAKDRTCAGCGQVFHSIDKYKRFCSLDCYNKSEEKRINTRAVNNLNRKPPGECKKCGKTIPRSRHLCDSCKPKSRRIGKCLHCGRTVASRYDVQFCKSCRETGIHHKKPTSTCVSCGAIVQVYNRKYCDFCWGAKMRLWRGIPRKKDENQDEIVLALERAGCSVIDASPIGGGCPDLFVGINQQTFLLEVKNPKAKGKLNKLQERWHAAWRGHVAVVRSPEEALAAVGLTPT